MRSKRPTIWIPKDDIGVSEDEIKRTLRLSKHIKISNEGAELDKKGNVVVLEHPLEICLTDIVEL